MALAQSADRRIAGHLADGGKRMCQQRRFGAHARGGGGGLYSRMTTTNNRDVEYSTPHNQDNPGSRP